jgi:hypothetical protein
VCSLEIQQWLVVTFNESLGGMEFVSEIQLRLLETIAEAFRDLAEILETQLNSC